MSENNLPSNIQQMLLSSAAEYNSLFLAGHDEDLVFTPLVALFSI